MEKRTKFLLLILIALLLLGLGLYLLLSPYLKERAAQRAAQPPALPTSVTPVVPGSSGGTRGSTTGTSVLPPPSSSQMQNLVLEQKARAFVERIGSGSSEGGFLGYTDALVDATSNGREALRAEQKSILDTHPVTAGHFGVSTRSVAARVTKGKAGDGQVTVEVDAVETIDDGTGGGVLSAQGKRLTIVFAKQKDGKYLMDSFKTENLKL